MQWNPFLLDKKAFWTHFKIVIIVNITNEFLYLYNFFSSFLECTTFTENGWLSEWQQYLIGKELYK